MEGKGAAVSIITSRPHESARLQRSLHSLLHSLLWLWMLCVMFSDITRSVEQQDWALLTQPAMLPYENNNTQPTSHRDGPPSPTFTLNNISTTAQSEDFTHNKSRLEKYFGDHMERCNQPNTLTFIFPGNTLLLDTENTPLLLLSLRNKTNLAKQARKTRPAMNLTHFNILLWITVTFENEWNAKEHLNALQSNKCPRCKCDRKAVRKCANT